MLNLLSQLSQQWQISTHLLVLGFYSVLAALVYSLLGGFIWLRPLEAAKKPYLTWAILLPLLLVPLWLGPPFWIVAVTLVSIYGFKEFAKGTGLYDHMAYCLIVDAVIIGLGLSAIFKDYGLFMALPIWGAAILSAVPVLTNTYEGSVQRISLSIIGLVYFGWFAAHWGYLSQSAYGLGYVLFALLATQFNDALAFLWGKLFGKTTWTKLSPKKTIEGSLLALVSSIALAFANWPMAFPHFQWWLVLLIGLLIGVGGQIGDLVMSAFKRDIGIKDFGSLLPGHGGILDRIDSLLWVGPLFLHTARAFHGGFGY
jgi:phosphatidate cytidylyltransferase